MSRVEKAPMPYNPKTSANTLSIKSVQLQVTFTLKILIPTLFKCRRVLSHPKISSEVSGKNLVEPKLPLQSSQEGSTLETVFYPLKFLTQISFFFFTPALEQFAVSSTEDRTELTYIQRPYSVTPLYLRTLGSHWCSKVLPLKDVHGSLNEGRADSYLPGHTLPRAVCIMWENGQISH